MHKIYYALIFIAFFCISTVDCQGGGGRGGGGGGGGRGGGYRGSSGSRVPCNTDECKRAQERTVIIICVVLFGGGLGGLAIFLICLAYCSRNDGKPSVDNATFVRPNRQGHQKECRQQEVTINLMNSDHDKIFRNGIWSSRYRQYEKWNGPFEFILSFEPQTCQLRGEGSDNIGKFNIIGHYSSENFRMGITKTYIKGTGDQSQNLGHDVTIQLTRNKRSGIFYGKWYVDTHLYSGEDIFTLQFVGDCEYYDNV